MPESNKQDVNMPFPVNGVFESRPHDQQPERTTTDAKNVLSYDIDEDRQRGGRRLGTKKATPENGGGGLGTNRVQMLDVVPLPQSSPGIPGGVVNYTNSVDEGIPEFTPADLTNLAVDPNQDGNPDDVLGTDSPAPVSGGTTLFPLPMFECTEVFPEPTSAEWESGKYDHTVFYGGSHNKALVPVGANGPVSTWNTGSPGLWHVRSVDGRDGCIYPRAPFDKVTGDNDGKSLYNQMPSRFLAENKTDAPLGFIGGGNPTEYKPTNTTTVSSVVFPFQDDSEVAFHNAATKDWAVSCSIRTPASDELEATPNNSQFPGQRCHYKVFGQENLSGTGEDGFLKLGLQMVGGSEYFYGFVFRVKATVSNSETTIDAGTESTQLLFVGFHQPSTENERCASAVPRLKIGTIRNPDDDQITLVSERTFDVGDDGSLDFKTWYGLEVHCQSNQLEVYLDGLGPLATSEDALETRFNLADFVGEDSEGTELSVTRARTGLFFRRKRCVRPEEVFAQWYTADPERGLLDSVTGDTGIGDRTEPQDYNGNVRIRQRTVAGGAEVWIDEAGGDPARANGMLQYGLYNGSYPSGSTQPRSGPRTEDHSLDTVCLMKWSQQSTNDYHTLVYFRDKEVANSISYPATHSDYVADPETSGYFYEGDQDGWKLLSRGSELLHRAEFGGDFLRDWNEPFFHNVQWRNIENQTEAGRVLIAASGGELYASTNVGDSFGKATVDDTSDDQENIIFDTSSLRISGVEFYSKYYMTDGKKYLVLDIPTRVLSDWSVLCKALDEDGNVTGDPLIPGGANSDEETDGCRLITKHLGRIVLAGFPSFPNNWFMSGQYTDSVSAGEGPNDWDVNAGDAISGTSTNLSEIGEPIRALFPFREDSLVFGCQNSIMLLQGDPGVDGGSSITNISRDIGIVGPDAWAHGPNRSLYFFGSNGLYYMSPNEFNVSQTNRLSVGRMDREFASVNLALFNVKLLYDYFLYGLHIFMSPKSEPSSAVKHYFYDERSQALWPMEYPTLHGPTASVYYPDPEPGRRRVLMGGFDGHVRYFDAAATSDDGTTIDSHVWIGPFEIGRVTETKVMRMAAVLDAQSPDVEWGIYVGDTAEEAKSSEAVASGSWKKGRNLWKHVRARGHNIFVKLSSNAVSTPWSLENITATLAVAGRVRERN